MNPIVTPESVRFGSSLRTIRKKRGLTMAPVATGLDVAMVTVSRIERGERLPDWGQLQALYNILNVSQRNKSRVTQEYQQALASRRKPTRATRIDTRQITPEMIRLGNAMRGKRLEADLSGKELAHRLGVTTTLVLNIELGRSIPTIDRFLDTLIECGVDDAGILDMVRLLAAAHRSRRPTDADKASV